ncbi:MAG TPA: hypothetical protein VGH74_22625 [Planctomycetaceae bacterium]|jgi:hypothetical protein
MAALLTKSERRTVYLSVILFALSMLLPAYRIRIWNDQDGRFSLGYEMAWLVEGVFWTLSWESIKTVFAAGPVPSSGGWDGLQILLPGAMANHLFLLAGVTVLFRRFRMAVAFSTLSALCAIGCLLPWQISAIRKEWSLGPGYFV